MSESPSGDCDVITTGPSFVSVACGQEGRLRRWNSPDGLLVMNLCNHHFRQWVEAGLMGDE